MLLLIDTVSLNVMTFYASSAEFVGQGQFRRTTEGSAVDP